MQSTELKHTRREALFAYAPLLFWIGAILYMSTGAGSFEHTSRFIGPLLAFLFPEASPETLAIYHSFIRKCGHFAAYALLGFLAFRAFRRRRLWPLISLGIVVTVATLDEFLQSYNAGRTSTVADIFLDLAGGAAAVSAILVWQYRNQGPVSAPRE